MDMNDLHKISPEAAMVKIADGFELFARDMEHVKNDVATMQEAVARQEEAVEKMSDSVDEIRDMVKGIIPEVRDSISQNRLNIDDIGNIVRRNCSAHEGILKAAEEHIKNDVTIDAWLGARATAVIKAVLVFVGGALMAYVWKMATGL